MELALVIKKPQITEKTMAQTSQSCYTFQVDKRADKNLVALAVEKFFKVKVKKVRLLKVLGKTKPASRFSRKLVKKPDWKKAIVQLVAGQKIDLFEELKKK